MLRKAIKISSTCLEGSSPVGWKNEEVFFDNGSSQLIVEQIIKLNKFKDKLSGLSYVETRTEQNRFLTWTSRI
mgnify:CR=1 FL=1